MPIAARLAGLPQVELHLLPGRVRPTTQAAVGADTVAALAELRADVAFLGTNGITVGPRPHHPRPRRGRDQAGDGRRRAPGGRARRRHARSASRRPIRFATLGEIDVLVTDGGIERRRTAGRSRRAGVEVVVA